MLVNCKNGVSSYEVARDLGVTQKSAWFMLHRLRYALANRGFVIKSKIGDGGKGSGAVEVDETFIGGKAKNMHKSRRQAINKTRSEISISEDRYPGKTAVMGMLDRELRQVRAKVVPNVKRETLQAEILKEVRFGSKVFTDERGCLRQAASSLCA